MRKWRMDRKALYIEFSSNLNGENRATVGDRGIQ